MRIYIIGKVTGLDYEHCCDLFKERQKWLEEQDHIVVNPVEIVPEGTQWIEAMKICLAELIKCEGYSVLPNALSSRGGLLELFVSKELKLIELDQPF
ncbi:MAG: DUF4406 domain-containing protein [Chlorobium sp.]|jgi:hypothetical protein|nr:DUF4406 domain-containing protein [Chlorobium sp.]